MKAVGVKILKNQLSRYLKMVKEGETVYVAEHDEIIAEIHRPIQPIPEKISPWEAYLNQEERRGVIIRPKKNKSTMLDILTNQSLWPKELEGEFKSILEESRSDRFYG